MMYVQIVTRVQSTVLHGFSPILYAMGPNALTQMSVNKLIWFSDSVRACNIILLRYQNDIRLTAHDPDDLFILCLLHAKHLETKE